MKRIVGITITSIIVIIGAFYLLKSKSSTTFNEFVHTAEITSIDIIRSSDDKEVVIENGNDIKELLKHFSEAELMEDEMGSIDFNESYWITLRSNNVRKLGMTVYDDKYLLIFDYNKNNSTGYQIISVFDSSNIEQYFD